MKSFIKFALIMLLVEGLSVRHMTAEIVAEPWAVSLQTAMDLSRRSEYRQALEKYQAFLSKPPVSLTVEIHAYVLSQMADADNGLGDYAEGEARAREVLRLLETAHEAQTSIFAIAEGVLADALRGEGNYFEEKNVAEQSVSIAKQTLDVLSPRFAILLTTLARALEDRNETGRALKLYQQAVFIFAKAGEGNRIDLGTAYANLANAYVRQGNPKKAVQAVNLALATWEGVLPPNHALTLYPLNAGMLSYEKLRAYPQAEALIPKLLALASSSLGPNHPDRALLLSNVACLYIAEKKYKEAEPLLEESVAICKRVLPAGHPVFRNSLANYSYVLAKLNRSEEASRVRAESQVLLAFPEQSK